MDQIKQALGAMYLPGTAQEQKKHAAAFLETFQKSPEAWPVVHQLLADPSLPLEYRMFAAQTLRSKATYDLLQLPRDSLALLKDSVLLLLAQCAPADRLIRTQLSLALCQLALQYLEWDNAMGEITAALSTAESLPALLEFLKILPEELTESNKTALTDDEFNRRTAALIGSNVDQVLLLLAQLHDQRTCDNALLLDTLTSWIKECAIEKVLAVDLLANLMFKSLVAESTFERACECVGAALRETADIDNYPLIDAIYHQLLEVHQHYAANPYHLEDPDVVSALTKLYVDAGESWHVLIAKNPAHFKPLVQLLLQCCRYEDDLDVVKYTFYFWYMLKQMLTLPKFEEARKELAPIYLDLILVIIAHLRYPIGPDQKTQFADKEEEDKFKDFRYEMGDVLKDCCAVAGGPRALQIPFLQIQNLLAQQLAPWPQLEAPLFSMRVMAKEVSHKESTILPTIMEMLVQLPEHPEIRYAATLVLGRYTEWTAQNPKFLEVQLNYIIKGFDNPHSATKDVSNATCQALMYFCQDCAPLLVNYMDQLYMLYQQVRGTLDVKATYDLVDGLAHVIKALPEEQQLKSTHTFLDPTVLLLQKTHEQGHAGDDAVATALYDEGEILSIFFRILRCLNFEGPQYPVAQYFCETVWPLVTVVLGKHGALLKVSERLVKVVKHAVQGCSVYLTPILPQMAQLLHHGFQTTCFGCYLWVSGVMIREFSDEVSTPETHEVAFQLGLSQSAAFFAVLKSNTIDVRGIPDVIEDYFNMANDLLMYFPDKVTASTELTSSILNAAVVALSTSEERNPLMAAVHFFIDLLSWGSPYPPVSFFDGDTDQVRLHVKQFLVCDNHGPRLAKVVLHGLIYKYYNDPDANDLLIKILTVAPDTAQAIGWVHAAAAALPNVSDQELHKLVGAINVALPNKDNRRVRMAVKDFVSWYTRKNVNSRANFA